MERTPARNPYLNRAMIRQRESFFGRRNPIARILSRLGADPPQSVSVVGERRIGKSSLLHHLTHPEVRKEFLGPGASLTVVLLDCQQMTPTGIEDFFALCCERILAEAPSLESPPTPGYSGFRRLLESADRQGLQLALFLDEFDAVTSNKIFDAEFYGFLRSMANNYPLAYLTSSKVELQRLCHSEEISDSPFFNIFSNLVLTPFEPEEAVELIEGPSEKAGHPLAAYRESILEWAGLFPLYLQIACSAYFEAISSRPSAPPEPEGVAAVFLEEAGPHFDYAWSQADAGEKRVLSRIGRGRPSDPEDAYLRRRLRLRGYLVERDGQDRLFSPLFAEHILDRPDAFDSSSSGFLRPAPPDWDDLKNIQQYRLLSKADEGGMGVVYRALDTALQRQVALKLIQPHAIHDSATRRRFLLEARSAASLSHPSIASVFELIEHADQIVMVMEWIEGRTLKRLIREEGPLEWPQLVGWMLQICDGLQTAHGQGLVHRDVKSSNLMISDDNQVKITDFGLAKEWNSATGSHGGTDLTREGMLIGTLDYISPEQARSEPVDSRSDLFSLGVVLFESLTGKLPFHRPNPSATLRAILDEPAPYLGLYEVENAERLDRVLRRLLAKSPDGRYGDAAELKRDLKALLRRPGLMDWLR